MIIKNEKGFVSIIVASTIMIILALVTIGFTSYVQREQRQSLDRQLSRQALYAAESGINETFKVLLEDSTVPDQQTECNPNLILGPDVEDTVIDDEAGVEYTCILYDKNPTRLYYTPGEDNSKIVQLTTSSGNPFEDIVVSWGNADGSNNSIANLPSCDDANEFPTARTNTIPLLKIDLTNTSSLNRTDLIANTDYMYLSPCSGGAGGVTSIAYNKAEKGNIVRVECSSSGSSPCTLRIILNSENSSEFLARFRPVYATAIVEVSGNEQTSSAPLTYDEVEFDNQFSIDVTAKAADVIRRLRAAIPLETIDDKPEAVLQSFTDVCKLLEVNFDDSSTVDTCP